MLSMLIAKRQFPLRVLAVCKELRLSKSGPLWRDKRTSVRRGATSPMGHKLPLASCFIGTLAVCLPCISKQDARKRKGNDGRPIECL